MFILSQMKDPDTYIYFQKNKEAFQLTFGYEGSEIRYSQKLYTIQESESEVSSDDYTSPQIKYKEYKKMIKNLKKKN